MYNFFEQINSFSAEFLDSFIRNLLKLHESYLDKQGEANSKINIRPTHQVKYCGYHHTLENRSKNNRKFCNLPIKKIVLK